MDTPTPKLNKQDLRRCWRSWMMYNLSSMSFERLESYGFCLSMMPALKKLYPEKNSALRPFAAILRSITPSRSWARLLTAW